MALSPLFWGLWFKGLRFRGLESKLGSKESKGSEFGVCLDVGFRLRGPAVEETSDEARYSSLGKYRLGVALNHAFGIRPKP